jgi:hypothetical protein
MLYLCIVVSSHSGFNVRKDNKYNKVFLKKKIFEIKKRTGKWRPHLNAIPHGGRGSIPYLFTKIEL